MARINPPPKAKPPTTAAPPPLSTETLQSLEVALFSTPTINWAFVGANIYADSAVVAAAGDQRLAAIMCAVWNSCPSLLVEVKKARELAYRLRRFVRCELEGTEMSRTEAAHQLIIALTAYEEEP